MADLYLFGGKYFDYGDSDNYYDIDVNNILLYNDVTRYNDLNRIKIAPLQFFFFFFGELDTYTIIDKVMSIYSDDKKLFKK